MLPSRFGLVGASVLFILAGTAARLGACHNGPEQLPAQVSSLFDFGNYQQLFAKHYGSHLEAITRRVYFMANAFKVYVSGVAYKFWRQRHYLALNEFSDHSPQELDMMLNKVSSRQEAATKNGSPKQTLRSETAKTDSADEGDLAEIAEALEGEIQHRLDEPALRKLLERLARRKREATLLAPEEAPKRPPRRLSMDRLIQGNPRDGPALSNANGVKVNRRPTSNNPYYDELAVEPITRGLFDQQEEIETWPLYQVAPSEPEEARSLSPEQQARQLLYGELPTDQDDRPPGWLDFEQIVAEEAPGTFSFLLPDKMFVDLRRTGCWFEPRHQGQCGACYAFASVAMMEFLFCKKTGQLTAFSEQYMIDCGTDKIEGMMGCTGSVGWAAPNFIHNFGLELQSHYPYLGRQNQCPYSSDTDLKRTGFIRMDLTSVTRVHSSLWPDQLRFGPLYVNVAHSPDFFQYGGGVDDGQACPERATHAMVLVGHGREDGQEFWLLRNSFGVLWGERGYYKLSRSAPERCIEFQEGYAFGAKDGQNYVEPRTNERNANVIQMRSLLKQMDSLQQQQQGARIL